MEDVFAEIEKDALKQIKVPEDKELSKVGKLISQLQQMQETYQSLSKKF